jgi:hypothetical protein
MAWLLALSGTALAAAAAPIQIDNRSGKAIAAIAASPKGEAAEPLALLGEAGIAAGEPGEIALPADTTECVFDLKIAFADGSRLERSDMDLCQTEVLIVE